MLPIEVRLLEAVIAAQSSNLDAYGFVLAKRIADSMDSTTLVAHGTLYKALSRLTTAGLLEAAWEQAELAEDAGRPRRRLYTITGVGEESLARQQARDTATVRTPATVRVGIV